MWHSVCRRLVQHNIHAGVSVRAVVHIVPLVVACLVAGAVLTLGPIAAYAFDETGVTVEDTGWVPTDCVPCHPDVNPATSDYDLGLGTGPHGGFATTVKKCACCHSVHASGSALLLPATTVKATCMTCHDGTQGRGVYGAIEKRLGAGAVKADHSIDTTALVPGGSRTTGGPLEMGFAGVGGTLTCSDCHSVHATDVVAAFVGDRVRYSTGFPLFPTTKLLKNQPGFAETPVDYGSDWCLGCHQGRESGLVAYHNHPVDSIGTYTSGDPFDYGYIARLDSDDPTSNTVISTTNLLGGPPWGGLGASNRGYLMPVPRTPEQGTHKPICQQCHEDARSVGVLTGDGSVGDAVAFAPSLDGALDAASPRFQNFPHETTNYRLLVEGGATNPTDDLCLNCHPAVALP